MDGLKIILGLILAGVLFFLVFTNLIIPFFGVTFEYGSGIEPCNKANACQGITASSNNIRNAYCLTNGSAVVTCTNCVNNTGYSTFLSTCHSLIANGTAVSNDLCFSCSNFGYKTSMTGLMLFTFFIVTIVIIVVIIKTITKK